MGENVAEYCDKTFEAVLIGSILRVFGSVKSGVSSSQDNSSLPFLSEGLEKNNVYSQGLPWPRVVLHHRSRNSNAVEFPRTSSVSEIVRNLNSGYQ